MKNGHIIRKYLLAIGITLLVATNLKAQTSDFLTNQSVIKMVMARLSDEIIIDEINSSKVKFDLSADSVKILTEKNVSAEVIQAMKTISGMQTPAAATVVTSTATTPAAPSVAPAAETPVSLPVTTDPASTTAKENEVIEDHAIKFNVIGYVQPMKDLITFFDKEQAVFADLIHTWDGQIKDFIEKAKIINEKNLLLEKELTEKKSVESKKYSNEIIALKNSLTESRGNFKALKTNMLLDGVNIVKKLGELSKETDRATNDKFSEISRLVKKSNPNPFEAEISELQPVTKLKADMNVVYYVAPANVLLFFYQNEVVSLQNLMAFWSSKAEKIIQEDAEQGKKLDSLKSEIEKYAVNAKKNKTEIASLKKQCTVIVKDRKQLAKQMETDSDRLTVLLIKMSIEVRSILKERFDDIIENINYSYQEKLNI